MWFRRDLRLADNPALLAAAVDGPVVPVFVLDDTLRAPSGAPRLAFLYRCLRELDASLGGRLVIRTGRPAQVLATLAHEVGATSVHAAADYGPYGHARDEAAAAALADVGAELVLTGSPYAVEPGRTVKPDGSPYRVFTPFYRAWSDLGWAAPVPAPEHLDLLDWASGDDVSGDSVPADPPVQSTLPAAGEAAALARLGVFVEESVAGYARTRNVPGADGTSKLSPYLKYGALHPRQVLAALASRHGGEEKFRKEIAWREFYADVLWHHPESVREPLVAGTGAIAVDTGSEADRRFAAWALGQTGFPIVDAAMRQLLAEAWLPNRVRMVVASFLIKDLHLDWRRGARHFMAHLVDGDLASNAHGWQWVAGTGTDAAPYHRVFNPVLQGEKFDPTGAYVRRWVPELADVPKDAIHQPWTLGLVAPDGYPAPIVDHGAERRVALDRYAAAKS